MNISTSYSKKLFRNIMGLMPDCFRKYLTQKKIAQIMSHLMTEEEIWKCMSSEEIRLETVARYKNKYPKQALRLEKLIEEQMKNISENMIKSSETTLDMKKRMEFIWFAYGFYPDEYTLFDFQGKDLFSQEIRSFVSDTERWAFRFAANDFTQTLLSDKAETYKVYKKFYKREAVSIENKSDYPAYIEFIRKHPVFVQKVVDSSRGDGVILANNIEDYEEYFFQILKLGKVFLEECIVQNKELGQFNESSINTLRISTYNTRKGIVSSHGIIRTGRKKSFVDNAAKGGISATVDVNRGIVCSDGYAVNGERFKCHPDSNIVFNGFVLPDWDEALQICKSIAETLPSIKYISFDLAYSEKGWVIVEINSSGGYHFQAGTLIGFRDEFEKIISSMDLITDFPPKKVISS